MCSNQRGFDHGEHDNAEASHKSASVTLVVPMPSRAPEPIGASPMRSERGAGRAARTAVERRSAQGVVDRRDRMQHRSCVGSGIDRRSRPLCVGDIKRVGAEDEASHHASTWMACKETDEFRARPETMIEGAGTTLKAAVDVSRLMARCRTRCPRRSSSTRPMYTGNENAFYVIRGGEQDRRATSTCSSILAHWRTGWYSTARSCRSASTSDKTWDERDLRPVAS